MRSVTECDRQFEEGRTVSRTVIDLDDEALKAAARQLGTTTKPFESALSGQSAGGMQHVEHHLVHCRDPRTIAVAEPVRLGDLT